MFTVALPPKTGFSDSSAWIMRRFFLSCRLFFLMYAHSRLVTSVRGTALSPTISLSAGLGCIGFMNAALGFLADDFFFAIRSPLPNALASARAYHETR